MNDRMNELEIKISYLDDLVETLNQTVFRQQERINLLQEELRLLHQQVRAAGGGGAALSEDLREEIPPHY
ncbi:MAG: SlyX family protein [Betaproteobacteria bacterium]|nr:SlyX family protein [Betaproteobacteria bacterium]